MSAHDRGVEHLNEMRRGAHVGERVEECLEHACFAQAVEAFPDAVPGTETFRQSAPTHVLHSEEMQGFEKQTVIFAFSTTARQAGAKHRQGVRPILLIHLCRHRAQPPIRSEAYESRPIQRVNPQNLNCPDFVHTA